VWVGLIAAASGDALADGAGGIAEAEAARRRGDFREAAEILGRYCQSHPDDLWGHHLRGLALRKSGRPEDAVEAFRAGLALDPDRPPLLVNLGRAWLDLDRPEEARPALERAVALDPGNGETRRVLARALRALGQRERALEELREAARLDPDDPWTSNNLGRELIGAERFAEAVPPLARACRARDDVACFRNNLGIALERTGREAAAAAAYRGALAIDPDHAKARASLARVEARIGARGEEAGEESLGSLLESLAVEPPPPAPLAKPPAPLAKAPEPIPPDEIAAAPAPEEEVATEPPGPAESVAEESAEMSDDRKSTPKSPPKKKSKKKKRSRPAVEFSGAFALRLVYDDNVIHYSDEDLHEFETGPTPGKYSIGTAGDWILRPRLELEAETRALTGSKLQARLRISSWRYVENGVKDNESYSLLLKHSGPGRGNLQLTLYHSPESYLRNFRDRPPFTPRSTPMEYTDFSYTSSSVSLAHWRRLSDEVDGKFEVKRAWRYYNRPFLENDNWEWRFGGYLSWRFIRALKVTGEYYYSVVEARGADAAGESVATSDDGDASYERDSYEIGLAFYAPKNRAKLDDLRVTAQYQAYYFTSERLPDEDRYHVGRKDEITRFEVTGSTDPVWRSISFEGGYRHTVRDSSAPWETGEGESIDEDKDYTDDRYWIGAVYPF
jgi:Flp pilus assembly protein TadD